MNKVSWKTKLKVGCQVFLELMRKNAVVTFVVIVIFTLGYATKNVEDQRERKLAHDTLTTVQHNMSLECNARLLQNNEAAIDRMKSRDLLLAEQGDRLHDQGLLINLIAKRQQDSINFTTKEMKSIKKSAADAKVVAKATTVVVEKGLTDKDRLVINKKVEEKAK